MQVSNEILNNIASEMELGLICYIHRDTLEVVAIPDEDRFFGMEVEAWKEDIKKIKKAKRKFIEIKKMESSRSFDVMAEFAESLPECPTKIRLITALEGHKPFANFNHQIHQAADHKENWFKFKREKNIEWIARQLDYDPL